MRLERKVVVFALVFAMLFTVSCGGEKEISEGTTATKVKVDAVKSKINRQSVQRYVVFFQTVLRLECVWW